MFLVLHTALITERPKFLWSKLSALCGVMSLCGRPKTLCTTRVFPWSIAPCPVIRSPSATPDSIPFLLGVPRDDSYPSYSNNSNITPLDIHSAAMSQATSQPSAKAVKGREWSKQFAWFASLKHTVKAFIVRSLLSLSNIDWPFPAYLLIFYFSR